MKLYARIAETLAWKDRCDAAGNTEWSAVAEHRLACLLDRLPYGSGIDSETKIVGIRWSGPASNRVPAQISFSSDYHHMDEHGSYDGLTTHTVTVRPGWDGPEIRISGRDRNGIKEYLHDVWYYALTRETDAEGSTVPS